MVKFIQILVIVITLTIVLGYVDFDEFIASYPVAVIIIFASLDIFSRLFVATGVPYKIGIYFAQTAKGGSLKLLALLGLFMFVVSSLLNNLAAIYLFLPIAMVIFRTIKLNNEMVFMALAMFISTCNLGGAATPIGDLPAILLMSSGVIEFTDYLLGAFPLFLLSALIVIWFYLDLYQLCQTNATNNTTEHDNTQLAISHLAAKTDDVVIDTRKAVWLALVFLAMIVTWIMVDPKVWSFHYTAVAGTALALVGMDVRFIVTALKNYQPQPLISLVAILAMSATIAASGILVSVSHALLATTSNDFLLLTIIMAILALSSGLFQAGPASAAMLPLVIQISDSASMVMQEWIFIAYGAGICAGSSLFLWSATAGFALSGAANQAGYPFAINTYLKFGIINFCIQFLVSIVWIFIAIHRHSSISFYFDTAVLLVILTILALTTFGLRASLRVSSCLWRGSQITKQRTG